MKVQERMILLMITINKKILMKTSKTLEVMIIQILREKDKKTLVKITVKNFI